MVIFLDERVRLGIVMFSRASSARVVPVAAAATSVGSDTGDNCGRDSGRERRGIDAIMSDSKGSFPPPSPPPPLPLLCFEGGFIF